MIRPAPHDPLDLVRAGVGGDVDVALLVGREVEKGVTDAAAHQVALVPARDEPPGQVLDRGGRVEEGPQARRNRGHTIILDHPPLPASVSIRSRHERMWASRLQRTGGSGDRLRQRAPGGVAASARRARGDRPALPGPRRLSPTSARLAVLRLPGAGTARFRGHRPARRPLSPPRARVPGCPRQLTARSGCSGSPAGRSDADVHRLSASPYRRNVIAAIPSRQYGRSRGHGCQLA